jgi:D-lyxose ketol-isomerase
MATTPVAGPNTQTSPTPGTAIIAIDQNMSGGYIVNPLNAAEQGVSAAEPLFVNQVTLAATSGNGTTVSLQPGQSYTVIPNTTTPVTVAAASANHKFTAVEWP